jgi:hypothetical protein
MAPQSSTSLPPHLKNSSTAGERRKNLNNLWLSVIRKVLALESMYVTQDSILYNLISKKNSSIYFSDEKVVRAGCRFDIAVILE